MICTRTVKAKLMLTAIHCLLYLLTEQFSNLHVGLDLDFVLCVCVGLAFCVFFVLA